MKRINLLLTVVAASLLMASCATSKESRTQRRTIDGNWQVDEGRRYWANVRVSF